MHLRKIGKTSIAALLAVAALLTLTAAASADTSKARWAGVGQVLFVGPSQDPATPTTATADFRIKRNGTIQRVIITTQNEFVAGVLGGGPGGGAITECKDRDDGATCGNLNSLLSGSVVSSLHTSVATLRDITEGSVPVTLPTPDGPVTLNIPVLHGSLHGRIDGIFVISKGADTAVGTSELRINNDSTGTYACFGVTPAGPVPLPSLDSCINQSSSRSPWMWSTGASSRLVPAQESCQTSLACKAASKFQRRPTCCSASSEGQLPSHGPRRSWVKASLTPVLE